MDGLVTDVASQCGFRDTHRPYVHIPWSYIRALRLYYWFGHSLVFVVGLENTRSNERKETPKGQRSIGEGLPKGGE